jgi:hypothetical protein
LTPPTPHASDFVPRHANLYAIVDLRDRTTPTTTTTARTQRIATPAHRINTEATFVEATTDLGGAVEGGTPRNVNPAIPNVRVEARVGVQRRMLLLTGAFYIDPQITFTINYVTALPSGWSVSLDPSSAVLPPTALAASTLWLARRPGVRCGLQ